MPEIVLPVFGIGFLVREAFEIENLIVYDVNVKVYENGKQKSIAKRGFATRREAELYEAQIKLELQTGSAAMVGYGPESKQKLKEYLPKWYESYHHNLAKSTRYSYWSGISIRNTEKRCCWR